MSVSVVDSVGANIWMGDTATTPSGSGTVVAIDDSVLVVSLHSLWGVGQWAATIASVTPGANKAIAHGLIRTPNVALLGARTGANITLGATSPDGTSVYCSNGAGGNQNAELLMIAGHSEIS